MPLTVSIIVAVSHCVVSMYQAFGLTVWTLSYVNHWCCLCPLYSFTFSPRFLYCVKPDPVLDQAHHPVSSWKSTHKECILFISGNLSLLQ